jgi:hypothetical protein
MWLAFPFPTAVVLTVVMLSTGLAACTPASSTGAAAPAERPAASDAASAAPAAPPAPDRIGVTYASRTPN